VKRGRTYASSHLPRPPGGCRASGYCPPPCALPAASGFVVVPSGWALAPVGVVVGMPDPVGTVVGVVLFDTTPPL
jgi:hypothetical protein